MNDTNEPDPGPKDPKNGGGAGGGGGDGGAPTPHGRFDVRRQRLLDAKDEARSRLDTKLTDARLWQALALTEFDRHTDPTELRLTRRPHVADAIQVVTQFLIGRVKQRAAYALQARPFVPPAIPQRLAAHVVIAEEAFRKALVAAFPPVHGHLFPIRRFEQAFAAFVGGEIRTGLLAPVRGTDSLAFDGVPDGANYFCFAEAVLVFLKQRIETKFWTPLLRTFVGGAQVFATTYWNRVSRTWADYRCDHQRILVPAPVVLATVDQFYAAMDISRLASQFGEIVGIALRDDAGLPTPAPLAEEFA